MIPYRGYLIRLRVREIGCSEWLNRWTGSWTSHPPTLAEEWIVYKPSEPGMLEKVYTGWSEEDAQRKVDELLG